MHQTEREGEARTQRATQESEKTTDSEHIGPPECQSSLSRRQFQVKQFFFRTILDEWVHIPTKKQAERSDWFHTERYTHAGTQQHGRLRRRPIQSIFDHQNVSLRCRDDSSGWNSFRQIRIHSKKTSRKKWLILLKALVCFCTLKKKQNNSLARPSIIGPGFWMPWGFFFFFSNFVKLKIW